MEKVEAKRLSGAETDLEKAVQRICNDYAEDYYDGVVGFLKDLQYGCASGIVAELVYYSDTVKFYKNIKTRSKRRWPKCWKTQGCPSMNCSKSGKHLTP